MCAAGGQGGALLVRGPLTGRGGLMVLDAETGAYIRQAERVAARFRSKNKTVGTGESR